jgi:hypothetical protein
MFNLEQAIIGWRKQMLAVGIKSPAPLDELESHLRDEVEQQMRSGANLEKAFEEAVQSLGEARTLKSEFKKVVTNERKLMKKIMIIGAGILGVLFGMGLVLPALANYGREGARPVETTGFLILGVAIVLGGAITAFVGIKKRKA